MFESIQQVLVALWHQDFSALLAPGSATLIYLLIATFIWLESGFLPAAPLPCDSVVILAGTLAAMGVLSPYITFPMLIVSAAMGSWFAFAQGRWLTRLPRVTQWVAKVPPKTMQTVDQLLCRHGLVALFCARFVPGVRSLTPMMMGARLHHVARFHYFSWLSASLWVLLLAGLGFLLPSLPHPISRIVTMGLMLAPLITLGITLCAALLLRLKRGARVLQPVSEER